MPIAIRLDADNRIGMGHAVRCSVIAREMMRRGYDCVYYCRTNDAISGYLVAEGIPLIDVPLMPLMDEAKWLAKEVSTYDAVILDSYEFTDEYIQTINSVGNVLCCIDDNADHTYGCDIILNQNLYAEELAFKTGSLVSEFMLGGAYCLLREEFRSVVPITIQPVTRRIFMCFGGSDGLDYTAQATGIIHEIPDAELTVVLGPAALGAGASSNEELIDHPPRNVDVYHDPPSMSELMANCDIAVISSGSMVYEAASLGIPMVVIVQADNQKRIARYLDKNEAAVAFVDVPPDRNELYESVSVLIHDFDRRQRMHDISPGLVNRNGVSEVADYIIGAIASGMNKV
jgi:UDP-2,4-diacetamido-2,4,6-trideoxy-beta-L-altropyranose hydrolase